MIACLCFSVACFSDAETVQLIHILLDFFTLFKVCFVKSVRGHSPHIEQFIVLALPPPSLPPPVPPPSGSGSGNKKFQFFFVFLQKLGKNAKITQKRQFYISLKRQVYFFILLKKIKIWK